MRKLAICVLVCLVAPLSIDWPSPYQQFLYQVHYLAVPVIREFPTDIAFFRQFEWWGTAFAVDPDGRLITARHVVDPGFVSRELCMTEWPFRVEEYLVIMTVVGPTGEEWEGYGSIQRHHGSFCDGLNRAQTSWELFSTASVLAVDGFADLALIQVPASRRPYIPLNEPPRLAKGMAVRAVGWPRGKRVLEQSGYIENPCEPVPWDVIPQPTLRVHADVIHGMSGGPVLLDKRFAGLVVGIETEQEPSLAVSGRYAAQWYQWVLGRRAYPPSITCIPDIK